MSKILSFLPIFYQNQYVKDPLPRFFSAEAGTFSLCFLLSDGSRRKGQNFFAVALWHFGGTLQNDR